MNRKLISKAISNIDDRFIAEAMSPPAAKAAAPERTKPMKHSRKILHLILAACLIFALALSAYAHDFLGIRQMLSKTGKELPPAAESYIQPHTETAAAEDWNACVVESLCDESKILVTVAVSGGDKYIIAPTDADPDTLAVNIGIEGNLTLGEYARQQGKELLFVGAVLQDHAASGGHGSQHFEHTADNEMTILVQTDVWGTLDEAICHVYAVDAQWEKKTLDIPVNLSKAPVSGSSLYVPDQPDAIPGLIVGNATVIETPLGYTIRYMETVTDEEAWMNVKIEEFDGLVRGEGGSVLEDDGNWYLTVSGCTGTVGDTLIARFYDWDDREIGHITFTKQ
mgnify:CR=1 FL=1